MLRLTTIATGIAALLLAGAATAGQDPESTPVELPSAPEADVDAAIERDVFDAMKVVCKRVRPPTGTRIIGQQTRQQMCMTRSDWDILEQETQEAIRERDKGVCSGSSCAG